MVNGQKDLTILIIQQNHAVELLLENLLKKLCIFDLKINFVQIVLIMFHKLIINVTRIGITVHQKWKDGSLERDLNI